MGCVQSQSDPSGNNSAGGSNKRNAEGGGDNGTAGGGGGTASAAPLDPRLPLNARQKYSMLASWKGISRALEPTGIYMFIKYVLEAVVHSRRLKGDSSLCCCVVGPHFM